MFPREFIDSFLKGYSEEDKIKIKKDLEIVEKVTFDEAKPNDASSAQPVYLATAGGPGSAKTTTLETFLQENHLENYVYADPDQVSLKNMNFTYRKSLSNFEMASANSNYDALKNAYNKWRGASNYICHEMLQIAFGNNDGLGDKYSVAHGTTSTSPHMESLYKRIKARDYRIVLLLCYSADETRKAAIEKRENEQAFVQSDPNDVISKGVDFPKRFDDYFRYADEIHFYWNNELHHGKLPKPCARYIKNEHDADLTVLNKNDWANFCKKYLWDIEKNKIEICCNFATLIPKELLNEKVAAANLQNFSIYNPGLNIDPNTAASESKIIATPKLI